MERFRAGRAWPLAALGMTGFFWSVIALADREPRSLLRDLSQSAATTGGTVVTIEMGNHNRGTYRYQVDGAEFTGSTFMGNQRTGDSVVVWYDPRDPGRSTLEEPRQAYRDYTEGMVVLLIAAAALSTLGAYLAS